MKTEVLFHINRVARRARILAFFLAATLLPLFANAVDLLTVPAESFSPPITAGGDSYASLISADGRYVVFNSTANNLVHRTNGAPYLLPHPGKMNAFVRDRVQGTTTLISSDSTDTKSGEDDSIPTGISTNGQFVLFESGLRNLVTGEPIGANGSGIFIRDLANHTTTLVSLKTGATPLNLDSVMTPDARYVAFASGNADIFVRDLSEGWTRQESEASFNHLYCSDPVITPDAKFIAYLVTSLFSGREDVYVCNLSATNTFCVSSNTHGIVSGSIFTQKYYGEEISQDGKYVVYQANGFNGPVASFIFRHNIQTDADEVVASNAVFELKGQSLNMSPDGRFIAFIGQTNSSTGVFLWDGQTATTTFVSVDTNGLVPENMSCESPTLDLTGRYLSFIAVATGLVTNSVGTFQEHIYRRDLLNGTTELVDAGPDGSATNRTLNSDFIMSPDGRYVAFASSDSDFVTQDGNKASDVFVRDLGAETTELISARDPSLPTQTSGGDGRRTRPGVSADGHFAVFIGSGTDLVPSYTNRYRGVFVRDLINQSNFVASLDTNGLGNANGSATECIISGNGRYVAFACLANNLVPNDINQASDVFLRDLQTGTTVLVSTNGVGPGSANGASFSPVISSDGRYVTYFSTSTNIVPMPAASGTNLFVYDRMLGVNYLVTTNVNSAASTADGRYVVFSPVSSSATIKLYVWDSETKQLIFTNSQSGLSFSPVAISPNGRWIAYVLTFGSQASSLNIIDRLTKSNITVSAGSFSPHPNLQFSGDGRFLVYPTRASNSPLDFDLSRDIYVFDVMTRSNSLVSRSFFTGNAPAGNSDSPDISADGRYITYESDAADIVPGDSNGRKDIFLFDRQSESTVLLSASTYGSGTADYVSQSPAFTADGETVAFQSWASDLTENDFNQGNDLFLIKILNPSSSTNPPPVFTGQLFFSPGSGSVSSGQVSPQLTWAATPGFGYQVQYKTNLTDDAWLPVRGSVVIESGQAYVKDLTPDPDHRFYRIVAF